MKKPYLNLGVLAIAAMLCQAASADITIDVGDHDLLANTANQEISILVTSSDPPPGGTDSFISGMNLNAEIGDGFGVGLVEPIFQGPDGALNGLSLSGTIFASGTPSGFAAVSGFPSIANAGATSTTNLVADGVLVKLIVDTTGFTNGTFDVSLANLPSNAVFGQGSLPDTELLGPIGNASPIAGIIINNGSITIVPEPSSILLLLGLGTAAFSVRRRVS